MDLPSLRTDLSAGAYERKAVLLRLVTFLFVVTYVAGGLPACPVTESVVIHHAVVYTFEDVGVDLVAQFAGEPEEWRFVALGAVVGQVRLDEAWQWDWGIPTRGLRV